jgi:DNA-binding transcriptional LysR family regulator
MDRYHSMQVFVRVAQLSSFTKAAESLGMPKASVSTHVQQLETHVKARLFQRTTRTVKLTQDGLQFYQRCLDILGDFEEAETMFQGLNTDISGRVRIDMPTRLAKNVIIPNLAAFLKKYPKLEIELSSTDRKVDIIQEGFDCIIRIGNLADSEFIVRSLGEYQIINCVSPEYISRMGKPQSLKDLSKHHLVHYVSTLGARSDGFEYFEDGKYKTLKMNGAVTVNNTDAYLEACLGGLGIIQVPAVTIEKYLNKGSLIRVLKKYVAEPMPISLIYPNRRHIPRRVQLVMDWMSELILSYND